jgi:Tfp pilus assembly protein PilV
MIETLVSIVLLLVTVISVGLAMLVADQSARISEDRYQEYASLRNLIEDYKAQVSSAYPDGVNLDSTLSKINGKNCNKGLQSGAGGFPNLVRFEVDVDQSTSGAPIHIVTYFRAAD